MQPGTPIAEISRVANRELIKRGYQAVDSPKRIGHGIGMSRAEPPSFNEVETEIYRPGHGARAGTQSALGKKRGAFRRRCADHGKGSGIFDHRLSRL